MNVVDANVLLYAVNEQSVHHDEARTWLVRPLSGGAMVGLSWIAVLAFARLAIEPDQFPNLSTVESAFERVGHTRHGLSREPRAQ